jgi:hypothetical protein
MLIMGFTAVTNASVLAGSIFEFLKRPSRLHVAVASDVLINAGNLFTVTIGDQVITSSAVCPPIITSSAVFTAGLVWPDHYMIQNEPGLPGDRVVLSITRAAGNIHWAVQMVEVA